MISQWLSWLNCLIIGLIACLLVAIGVLWMRQTEEIISSNPIGKSSSLPKRAFMMPQEAYKKIGEPLLMLQNAPPTIQLPDLKQLLVYYGKNGRPDAQSNRTLLHFSFTGSKNVISMPPEEKIYLIYDKKNAVCRYNFSPNNEETSLWIEGVLAENEVLIKVFLKNDKGELITEPENHAQFKLPEKEFIRYAGTAWELGGFRVDGTLLARQRARWFGPDRFLEKHGGEEYQYVSGKQRIDFGEQDHIYSVFLAPGDCLIWQDNQWKLTQPGESSLNYPLLVAKKVEDRLMNFELWDTEGKGKVVLNLLKSVEPWMLQNGNAIQQMFKFVGARTKTQCVFEINQERVLLSPSDWLLLTQKGWKKLETAEEIEDYVKRKLTGTLFVFEGLTRKEERQVMKGLLYNSARSDYQTIEMPLQPGAAVQLNASKIAKEKETKEVKETEQILSAIPVHRQSEVKEVREVREAPPVMPPPVSLPQSINKVQQPANP